jgi:hypothetical protein
MKSFLTGLVKFVKALLEFLKSIPLYFKKLPSFLCGLWAAILRCFHRPPRESCCVQLPPNAHIRPDPMIYDQYYLMSMGLAITWDNPDIQLYDLAGNPVSPYGLNPATDYQVVVRCWNNSYVAPAANLLVKFSFLSFGIGVTNTPVAATVTDLGVKGTSLCPAFANFVWHTPATPGHYCLQADLVWPDDANPNNNLGQKNTQVVPLHSPAVFSVPVHNAASVRRIFDLEIDRYALPTLTGCDDETRNRYKDRFTESAARWAEARRSQAYGMFPVTDAWKVSITPKQFELAPNASTNVTVSIEPAAGTFSGVQTFNLHGFAAPPGGPRLLAGGVTLTVTGS